MGSSVLEFRFQGLGFRVFMEFWSLGFGVWGLSFWCFGVSVLGFSFGVLKFWSLGFRVRGLGSLVLVFLEFRFWGLVLVF